MHIFLVRHGESMGNHGRNRIKRDPDHLLALTDTGRKQSYEAGIFLANYCKENNIDLEKARIWRSPYRRTRETCEEFNKSLNITDIKENITLVEQQFGKVDSIPEKEWSLLYPDEYHEYARQTQNQGKFYGRLPMGESPFDVAVRIQQFIYQIEKDYEKEGIDTIIVFTHGIALRTFLLRYFNYPPEWFENEDNPKNCWIREIKDDIDLGYINKDM